MQTLVFRNWSMVEKERIARVLETSVENVEKLAEDMGLLPQSDVSLWESRGYITIIRANWHLLNYEQLLTLLNWTEEKLALVLKEEDFLSGKLGAVKPLCEKITYRALTETEKTATAKIKAVMQGLNATVRDTEVRAPFDFYSFHRTGCVGPASIKIINNTGDPLCEEAARRFRADLAKAFGEASSRQTIFLSYMPDKENEYHELHITEDKIVLSAGGYGGILRGLYRLLDMADTSGWAPMHKAWEPRLKVRCIYPFSASYQDMFEGQAEISCPDSLLEEYARVGINGIWLPALLYRMTSFPFAPELSEGWESRLENLRALAKRAASYGIKLYLYLNEPRSMPVEIFRQHPDLMGTRMGDVSAMCICHEKTRTYLEDAMENLCRHVPELGGFFLISLAENLTLCKSKPRNFYDEMCPRCKDVPTWKLASEMHEALYRGMKKAAPHMQMLFFDWGWYREDLGMLPGDAEKCIKALPKDVILLCQRELDMKFSRGGIESRAAEYAISVSGVSPRSLRSWECAKESGHGIAGKMQINNSWECSSVPYLPVLQRSVEQVEAMEKAGIDRIIFSWTLGGYPSPNIQLVSESFFTSEGETPDYRKKLHAMYGADSEKIWKATAHFSRAMGEYPFDKALVYSGPANAGVANIFYKRSTGRHSTMTCYTYDNLKDWTHIYPVEILEKQFALLCEEWKKGLAYLENVEGELRDIAVAGYIQFRSSYHQIRFIRLRDAFHTGDESCRGEILSILQEEERLAREMHKIMLRRPAVGFEAANHYYISVGMIEEKLVNLAYLMEIFGERSISDTI